MMDEVIQHQLMQEITVDEVWGVGRATTHKLEAVGVTTVAQLRDLDTKQARQLGIVVLERTVQELRSLPCMQVEDVAPQRKGIACRRDRA